MHVPFKALTLSYKHAPIAVREAVSLNETASRNLLQKIQEFTSAKEVLVLSTCNRTEVYYAAEKDLSREIIKLIALEKGFIASKSISPFFRHLTDPKEAMQHLYRVALGVESQVVGDMQILNQVKSAYQWSTDANLAGPILHRLLHSVFFANKRVVNETGFKDGAASAAYATVELVEELTKDLNRPRVLMIGLGDIGANVCRNFKKSAGIDLVVVNRTFATAEALALECHAQAQPWENVWTEITKADVVISSVPGDAFFISKAQVAPRMKAVNKFFIDLSIPRSVDSTIETLPGACVYNIDGIRNRASEALEKRMAALPEVHTIIAESLEEFLAWTQEMAFSPAIQNFKKRLEEIRQLEMARHLKHLNPTEKEAVEALTKSMLQKIIKLPVLELKAACKRGDSEELLAGLSALFNLEMKQEV
nr:glutamyl-tRNA reductase [Rufibacter sp. LB8]